MTKSLAEQAREYTERALATIAEVMSDPFAEDRDKLSAAKEMLDRGHGKATIAVIAIPAAQQARQIAASMTRAQLIEVIERAELPRLRHETEAVVEAEFTPVEDPLLK